MVTSAIPVSVFPPLPLPHPLGAFGGSFKVLISTGLTLSPDTVSRAAFGVSIMQLLKKWSPSQYASLRTLQRAAQGKNRISSTTRRVVVQDLQGFISESALEELIDGYVPPGEIKWESDWQVFLRGLSSQGADDWFYQGVERLAALDEVAMRCRELFNSGCKSEGISVLEIEGGITEANLRDLYPNCGLREAILIETSLRSLAWLELQALASKPPWDASSSKVVALLNQRRKPVGNWMYRVQRETQCKNLAELGARTEARVLRHDRPVGHALLRKWSSGVQLMPYEAAKRLVEIFQAKTAGERQLKLFPIARFLTFLVDLHGSSNLIGRTDWYVSQKAIAERYQQLAESKAK